MRTALLINCYSRRARSHETELIKAIKGFKRGTLEITRLKNPNKLNSKLKRIVNKNPDLLIVAGGDGTVSDVVDQLVVKKIELAVIPLGTTNNFAKSLGIPEDISEAMRIALTAKGQLIDLGKVNGDYFTNVAGVGLSAEIAATISDDLKKKYGRMAYALHGLRLILSHRPFHATITDKNQKLTLNIKTHQLIIANGKYHAGSEIAADASLNTRELIVFKLGGTSRLSLLWHMVDFYIGRRRTVSHTSYLIAKDIEIKTDIPVMIELDGEVKERTPAHIEIVPRLIRVRH